MGLVSIYMITWRNENEGLVQKEKVANGCYRSFNVGARGLWKFEQ